MKKVLFVLLSLLIMAIAVSCDSSATVSADAVLDLSKVEAKAGDRVVIDVTCGSKTMPSQSFTIDEPSQKAPKYKIDAIRKTSGTIKVKVYRQYEPVTKSDTEEYVVAGGATKVEDFSAQGSYNIKIYPPYTITYDANGATGGTAPEPKTRVIVGQDVILAENTGNLEKTDYQFNGWNTKADGCGTHYDAGSGVVGGFEGDTTLYAEWLYSITYDANGATSGTEPASQTGLVPGDDVILAFNTGLLKKTDYWFKGWNTRADGSGTSYAVGSTVSGGFKENTTLYAEWSDKYSREDYVMVGSDTFKEKLELLSGYSTSRITSIELYKADNVPPAYISGTNVVNLGDYVDGDSRQGNIKGYLIGLNKIVVVGDCICGNPDCHGLFSSFGNATKIEIRDFDTSDVTDMGSMFTGCSALTSLDLSTFDTSNVTDMSSMFGDCSALTSLDITGFNPSKAVDNKDGMFSGCGIAGKTTITVNHSYSETFYNKTELGTSVWAYIPPSETVTSGTYKKTYSITYDANGATSGAVPASQTAAVPGDDVILAVNTGLLEKTDYWFNGWNTKADGRGTHYAAGSTVTGGFKSDTTLYAEWTNPGDYVMVGGSNAFWHRLELLSDYSQEDITSIEFYRTENVPSDYVLGTNTVNLGDYEDDDPRQGYIKGYLIGREKLVIVGDRIYGNPNCYWLFYGFSNVTQIKIKDFDTSNVTDMYYMFKGRSSLTTLDLSNFDTSKVTNMEYMFGDCSSLTSLNLSSFDTSNVTAIRYMFQNCSSLTELVLGNFNNSKVNDLGHMFEGCSSLTTIDLSTFNTSNVGSMYALFKGCSGLESLDLSNFNTSLVWEMGCMFSNCGKTGTTITINPEYQSFYDTTELGSSPWSYSSPVYTHN